MKRATQVITLHVDTCLINLPEKKNPSTQWGNEIANKNMQLI